MAEEREQIVKVRVKGHKKIDDKLSMEVERDTKSKKE